MTSLNIAVGAYTYTLTDATRTLASLDELWTHHDGIAGEFDADFTALRARAHAMDPITHDNATEVARLLEDIWSYFTRRRQVHTLHTGSVAAVLTSNGGVPKTTVPSAEVTHTGLSGDRQSSRVHHGRPWQALCLYSAEVIENFARLGHPISFGSTGENVTIRGIDWAAVRPGARITLGNVEAIITAYAIPCSQNKAWFRDGDFMTMSHERGDVSRVYAMITRTGTIATGDTVTVHSDR